MHLGSLVDALAGWTLAPEFFTMGAVVCSAALLVLAWIGVPGVDRIAGNTVQRLAKNSAAPIAGQLLNKVVDLAFAIFALRLLGATAYGEYSVPVVAWLYLKTISDYGLGTLVTREVAKDPSKAGQLLGSSTLLRCLLLVAVAPAAVAYAVGGMHLFQLSRNSAVAIGLLTISIIPGSYSEAINSIFNARERMELPAFLNVLTNLARAGFGLAALAAGLGVIGLAGVSVLATTISMVAFHLALRHLGVRPQWSLDRAQARWFLVVSWPLLMNSILMHVFFRGDEFIIQAVDGDRAVGVYDAAYKYVNMLLLVPSYFTIAAFPILSRYAHAERQRLVESYQLAIKLMVILALPIVIATFAVAPFLIEILGGHDYLPDSATALRILIWFLPMSYVSSVTQYLLIAIDRQRVITWVFAAASIFNVGLNLLLVPRYGIQAAAAVTVATELVLFVPFQVMVARWVGAIDWRGVVLGPLASALLMGAAVGLTWKLGSVPAAILGLLVYAVALVAVRAVGRREYHLALALLGRSQPVAS